MKSRHNGFSREKLCNEGVRRDEEVKRENVTLLWEIRTQIRLMWEFEPEAP